MKLLPLNHSASTHCHPEIAIVESFFISVADMHFNVIAVAWLTIAALCPYRLWSHIGAGSTTTWTSFQVPQGYHSPKQWDFLSSTLNETSLTRNRIPPFLLSFTRTFHCISQEHYSSHIVRTLSFRPGAPQSIWVQIRDRRSEGPSLLQRININSNFALPRMSVARHHMALLPNTCCRLEHLNRKHVTYLLSCSG